jgi:hypothetical protein
MIRDIPEPLWLARPSSFSRRAAGSDASRRLLQSEQPTSTTAGSTNPRSALADTARPARAGPMGLRPHPPHRPLDPGDAAASTPASPLRAQPGPPPGTSRGFTSQGPASFARRRLSLFVPRGASCLSAIRSLGAAMRASPEGVARSRELRPNPIRSDTPRHDTVAPPAGEPMSLAGPPPGQSHADCHLDDAATRTFALASTREKQQARGPPYVLLAQAARRLVSTLPPFDGFGWDEPTNRDGTLTRSTCADRPAPFGTV